MHEHDHDLIATVAEGLLAAELAFAAEAEISACPQCSADLASQRLAIDALGGIGPVAMTSAEAASIRNAVAGVLGLADPVAPAPRRARRSPWPAIAIAAGLAGIITIVPALGLLTPGDDDSSAMTVAASLTREESATANDDALEGAPLEDAATPTASATAESGEELAASGVGAITSTTGGFDTTPPPETFGYAADGEAAIRDLYKAGPAGSNLGADQQLERSTLTCNAQAEQLFGNESVYLNVPATLDDGRPVVLYVSADWQALIAFDIADCSIALAVP